MKIGFEAKRIYHNKSGLGNYGRNLLSGLATAFPDDTFVLYNPKKAKIEFGNNFSNILEKKPSFKNSFYSTLWRQALVSNQAAKDHIQIFHGLSGEIPKGLKKNKIKSVLTVHDVIFKRYPKLYKTIDRKIYWKKLVKSVKSADQIVAISEQTKADLIQYLGLNKSAIKVIYQDCQEVFREKRSSGFKLEVSQKYKLPKEYLLFVGTLEERKNIEKLIIASQKHKLPLVLIGRKTKYFLELLSNNNWDTTLIHTPTVWDNKELSAIYQSAKIFVYLSIFEGFGIPVLEALVSKTAVITSNLSSLPEAAGPNSILCDPYNQEEINQNILELWESESKRNEMILNGFEYAKKFDSQVISKQWNELYSDMLQK